MTLKKDKQKVLGENFDDDHIKTFLEFESYGEVDPDYHLLEKAYRGMKADNFATFVKFFIEEGHNINAKNPQGKTFLDTIHSHRLADEHVDTLKTNGAH